MVSGLFFDSATMYYRAFFAVPDSVRAPDGTPSGAVRGFLDMAATIITQYPAELIAFAWDDDWRPDWRVELIPSYKTHRLEPDSRISGASDEEVPDDLAIQITAIAEILDAIGVARLGEPGFEADDILGSLVAQQAVATTVVTGDKDLFQLVNDATQSRVLSITKGLKNLFVVTDDYLLDNFGVTGSQYAGFAALRGDPSDGLPGVKGIGAKGAANLIAAAGSLEQLLEAVLEDKELISPAHRRKLLEQIEEIPKMLQVVRVRTDAIVTRDLKQLLEIADVAALRDLSTEWGVERQVNRLLVALNLPKLGSV